MMTLCFFFLHDQNNLLRKDAIKELSRKVKKASELRNCSELTTNKECREYPKTLFKSSEELRKDCREPRLRREKAGPSKVKESCQEDHEDTCRPKTCHEKDCRDV